MLLLPQSLAFWFSRISASSGTAFGYIKIVRCHEIWKLLWSTTIWTLNDGGNVNSNALEPLWQRWERQPNTFATSQGTAFKTNRCCATKSASIRPGSRCVKMPWVGMNCKVSSRIFSSPCLEWSWFHSTWRPLDTLAPNRQVHGGHRSSQHLAALRDLWRWEKSLPRHGTLWRWRFGKVRAVAAVRVGWASFQNFIAFILQLIYHFKEHIRRANQEHLPKKKI